MMCPMPCLVLFVFVYKNYERQFVIAAYFLLLLFSLIKNNNESIFNFSLKSERCKYKQNRQLSFLVKRDTKIANVKVKVHEKRNPVHKI